jgi:competence protein ComEC
MLVDTGSSNAYVDHAERTILPHLRFARISAIDVLLLTHFDSDHVAGAERLLDAIPIGKIVVTAADSGSTVTATRIHRRARQYRIPVHPVRAGDLINLDPAVRVYVLGPESETHQPNGNSNDTSVVLRILYGHTALLLLGDVERDAESALVRRYGPFLESDIIKVAHHGSRSSSTIEMIDLATRSSGSLAVISSGRHRGFRLPHPTVVRRWIAFGSGIHMTRKSGAATIISNGNRTLLHKSTVSPSFSN